MFNNILKKKKYITVVDIDNTKEKPNVPIGLFTKCKKCGELIYTDELVKNLYVCNKCNYYFRMSAKDRINNIIDKGTFKELFVSTKINNPIDFPGYEDKLKKLKVSTSLDEGVICGYGRINGNRTLIAVMDSNFMMASMGSIVGEKITRTMEKAINLRLPVIIFTCSGGARMQEGIMSLMQMAKVNGAINKLSREGLLYISVLTDPTTGGVTASFALLGDIILAEPNATIGFAGRRVIENTIKQSLPEDFQTSEFLLKKGYIDSIIKRRKLKDTLGFLLSVHKGSEI